MSRVVEGGILLASRSTTSTIRSCCRSSARRSTTTASSVSSRTCSRRVTSNSGTQAHAERHAARRDRQPPARQHLPGQARQVRRDDDLPGLHEGREEATQPGVRAPLQETEPRQGERRHGDLSGAGPDPVRDGHAGGLRPRLPPAQVRALRRRLPPRLPRAGGRSRGDQGAYRGLPARSPQARTVPGENPDHPRHRKGEVPRLRDHDFRQTRLRLGLTDTGRIAAASS